MTNPPFGAKIGITDKEILREFLLAHKWEYSRRENHWRPTNKLLCKQDPQVLFIERCVQLLKPGGKLGIILPEGIVGNKNSAYILDYLRSKGSIFAIIDSPRTLFQPSTDIKTVILFFSKRKSEEEPASKDIFMAEARYCGHDKRGRTLFDADGKIINDFSMINYPIAGYSSRFGFILEEGKYDPYYLIPRYYNPDVIAALEELKRENKADIVSLGDLESKKIIKIFRGYEPGSTSYGLGEIPFIRTSDITNLEISNNTTIKIDREALIEASKKIRYEPFDILMVNDGRYKIGNTCILTPYNTDVVIQSHIRIIRVLKSDVINPFLLIYLLNTKLVQEQIKHKTFIQSTIATLGNRLKEVVLPIPKDPLIRREISNKMKNLLIGRAQMLNEIGTFIDSGTEITRYLSDS
jgi:type I restriction enzyme M protein